jgi:hypothetical protein
MLVSSLARNNPKNPERRSFSLESGVAYLPTVLAKVSIEMDSFLYDVVRGDRLPASIIYGSKVHLLGLTLGEHDLEPTLWRIGIGM